MSGRLAQAVINAQSACKLYTNSSGNAASITIHAQVLDCSANSEVSLQASSTDACVTATSSLSTACPDLNSLEGFVSTDDCFCGFYHNCTWSPVRSYCDTNTPANAPGNEIYPCCFLKYCCVVPGCNISCWGVCAPTTAAQVEGKCVSGMWCGNRYGYQPFNYLHKNCRSVHIATNGEDTNHYLSGCCDQDNSYEFHNYFLHWAKNDTTNGGYTGSDCNLGINCLILEGGCIDCVTCGGDCAPYYCHNFMANNISPMLWVQDIWTTGGPMVAHRWVGFGSCSCTWVGAFFPDNGNCYRSCLTCGCLSNDIFTGNQFGCVYLGCCNWAAADCNCNRPLPKVTQKPIMAGCGMIFHKQLQSDSYYMVEYDATRSNKSHECALRCLLPSAYTGGFNLTFACCRLIYYIYGCADCNCGGNPIKWLWYNPYVEKNYMEVLGTTTEEDGIYSVDFSNFSAVVDPTYGSASCCLCCMTFTDMKDAGMITKEGDTPTVWNGRKSLDIPTQPRLVGQCCWAIFWPCYCCNGDENLYWNGCWSRYTSGDLVTWTETTADGEVSVRSSSGSYPLNRTTTTYITDGSTGINQTLNHYFNGSCLDGSGTIEFRASANRLERTGIVLSNNDNLYVNNGSNSKMSVQVWGYDE